MTVDAHLLPSSSSAAPVRSATAPVRDLDGETFLWRATAGDRSRIATAPVVYVPGLGPHSTGRTRPQRMLQRLEVLLVTRGVTVWLVGRRSRLDAGTTIASLADDHARAIRARFDRPVDIVGESTGGSIALQLALSHPDVVQRLVLVSAGSSLARAGRIAQRDVADSLRAGRPRRAAGTMLGTTHRGPIRRRLLRAAGFVLGRAVIGRCDEDLIAAIEAEDAFDVGDALGRVTAPTVVVGGARDGYYTGELFRRTAALMPDATYVEYRSKGHLSAITSAAVRRTIRRHLRPGRAAR